MTRVEQKEKKLQEEKEFIESIKDKSIDGKIKSEFRKTSVWKNFRKKFYIKEIKTLKNGKKKEIPANDPITLKKLNKTFNLHHMDLDPCHYTDLNENTFIPLNNQIHDILHKLYNYYRIDPTILDRLKIILDEMCRLNNNKDIKDYK